MSEQAPPRTDTPVEAEIVYYEGSPRVRGELGLLVLSILAAVFFAAVPYLYGKVLTSSGSPLVLTLVCWLVLVPIVLIFPALWVKRHRYRVTNSRIDTREGILNIKDGTVWLWKVDDVQLNRTIIDRILAVGTITVFSSDATSPKLQLRSLPNPTEVYTELKRRVDIAKRQRGVIRMDGDFHNHPGNG
jgi:membrane protein YdbS with pleckstrin-like domain